MKPPSGWGSKSKGSLLRIVAVSLLLNEGPITTIMRGPVILAIRSNSPSLMAYLAVNSRTSR